MAVEKVLAKAKQRWLLLLAVLKAKAKVQHLWPGLLSLVPLKKTLRHGSLWFAKAIPR
jgi:hypothetical protein